jgi:hypothetical protein
MPTQFAARHHFGHRRSELRALLFAVLSSPDFSSGAISHKARHQRCVRKSSKKPVRKPDFRPVSAK